MLEKDCRYNGDAYSSNDIQLSQAISLKRIADALEKLVAVPTMPPLTEEQAMEIEKEWNARASNIIFNKS